MPKTKVLVIEDDRSLAEVLSYNLNVAGYDVLMATDGQDGLLKAQTKSPDIVLLDLMLPVVDGLDVCRRLRAGSATKDLPIIMLTAKGEESDELVGFSLGADDYVTKPFSVKVLLERMKALRRRRTTDDNDEEVTTKFGITIDRVRHHVTSHGRLVQLTRSEFRLLDTLIRHAGRVFDRTELIDSALGEDTMVMERTIDVHIRALRRKLGDRADVIETVRGVGYRFRDSEVPLELAEQV